MKTKIGVIGVGHLGTLHAKMYSQIPDCEFVGIYDIDKIKSEKVANEFNVKNFLTVDDLLLNVDAVSIATITPEHFKTAKNSLLKNKDILIEKPITSKVDEANELIKIANEKNLIIQVGHIERFNPAILALENIVINPLFIESHRLAQFNPRGTDVAVIHDLMIHDIDLILSLVKSPVKKIDANGIAVVTDSIDIANARLQFENGCVANITASRISQSKMRKMRLFQNNSYISIDLQQNVTEIYKVENQEFENKNNILLGTLGSGNNKKNIIYEQPEIKESNALKIELESFIHSIQKRTKPIVSGVEGVEALKVAQNILEAINKK